MQCDLLEQGLRRRTARNPHGCRLNIRMLGELLERRRARFFTLLRYPLVELAICSACDGRAPSALYNRNGNDGRGAGRSKLARQLNGRAVVTRQTASDDVRHTPASLPGSTSSSTIVAWLSVARLRPYS